MSILEHIIMDKVITFRVAENTISEEGAFVFSRWANEHSYPVDLPDDWEWVWVVKGRKKYVGSFIKRLSKWYFEEYGLKVPPAALSKLGSLLAPHGESSHTYYMDFTRELTWDAGDFGDNQSCYWGTNSLARDLLISHSALAVRFYLPLIESPPYQCGENSCDTCSTALAIWKRRVKSLENKVSLRGFARAWVVPVMHNEVLVVYNGYTRKGIHNQLQTLHIARILADYLGVSYKKIRLTNNGRWDKLLYINEGWGYLVGPTKYISTIESHDFMWECYESEPCCRCNVHLEDGDALYYRDDRYCDRCWNIMFRLCSHCNEPTRISEAVCIDDNNYYCPSCRRKFLFRCHRCGEFAHLSEQISVVGGYIEQASVEELWCGACADEAVTCNQCELYFKESLLNNDGLCLECAEKETTNEEI